ncbi:tryptophan synthase subunit alpha [Acidihalobacter aeolianus]|uniref:Tryptophan synthase alpha chain n=1 Tax=Acidihalobacter aeolianus TaxID=2792603 RepID=A0A1D8K8T6_9GAMM|nr:tryptophan synthase subunit alpha [Acidihalobacter aeolianus]AOV17367.1 tryptophan synthase subunit alpha [Acidihalobacter aeolianus]
MSRIGDCFAALRQEGRKALVTYITAGDPTPESAVGQMQALVAAGADLIELGVPFSDPMADGPVIQAACERALRHHVGLHHVLDLVRRFRESDDTTPVILMAYLNPIEVMGYAAFARQAAEAGVDGILVVDLPPEEAADVLAPCAAYGIDPIFLLSPTSDASRIEAICRLARGFVYYVSLKGVTGAATLDVDAVGTRLAAIRKYTDLPLGVGFGVRDAQTAARVAEVADAVVVGSAVVKLIEAYGEQPERLDPAIRDLVGGMRRAIDAVATDNRGEVAG